MKRIWVIIGSLFVYSTSGQAAPTGAAKDPHVEDSTREADKAAAHQASADADHWGSTIKKEAPAVVQDEEPTPVEPPPQETPKKTPEQQAPKKNDPPEAKTATPPPTPTTVEKASRVAPPVRRIVLNEMRGKLVSKSYDPKTIRLAVAGGFNVEFPYDQKSALVHGGQKINIDDLGYNDELIVRYMGKDLYAIEIERVSKAPRPE